MIIVLSGGGLHGLSLLGALEYLKLKPTHYIGTSIGSMLSVLLVIGCTYKEIRTHFEEDILIQSVSQKVDLNRLVSNYGLYNMNGFFSEVEKIIIHKIGCSPTLHELYTLTSINLTIVGTNLTEKHVEYFNHATHPTMMTIECLKISCCVPLLMECVRYNNSVYVDGGFVDNFPMQYASEKQKNEQVVGIRVVMDYPPTKIDNFMDYIQALIKIIVTNISDGQRYLLDDSRKVYTIQTYALNVELNDFIKMDKGKRERIVDILISEGRLQTEKIHLSNTLVIE
jgi:predicted acylesterase/phospholipase RssA